MMCRERICAFVAVVLVTCAGARGERVKDIVQVNGVRSNPLAGVGVVVGLTGTGDDSLASRRAITAWLIKQGINLDPAVFSSKNIALVMVTAQLPPFARRDSSIDVTVSAIGSASSLQGGTLLQSHLKGADGQVYAVAQGPLVIGGFSASGSRAKVQKNVPTVGRIPRGAHVEREERAVFVQDGEIVLQLHNPDFTTSKNIADAVNIEFTKSAHAPDAGSVRIKVPLDVDKSKITGFLDSVLSLNVEVDNSAVIVINERTGTIVVGENVRISTVALSHGNLQIVVKEKEKASQPNPLAGGKTKKVKSTDIATREENRRLHVLAKGTDLSKMIQGLNMIGVTPRDMISIFQALAAEGALQGRLVVLR